MKHLQKIFCVVGFSLIALTFSLSSLLAQGLDPVSISNPPADSWPSYHGDYSGRRHSRLTQITPQNVQSLGLSPGFSRPARKLP